MSPDTIPRRAVLAAAGVLLLSCSRERPRGALVPGGATVLALGDSLTFGTGAQPQEAWTALLQQASGWVVVNAGVPGDTSAQALARLPQLLQEHRPQLVVVSIGGNDFLRRLPESETRDNVRRICEQARAAGAQVLLVAVPRLSLIAAAAGSLTDHGLYAQVADELGIVLQRQGWAEVLSDETLRADAVHANALGYAQFARSLAATARAAGLLQR
jgi:lysophospholipase L1-like esterase